MWSFRMDWRKRCRRDSSGAARCAPAGPECGRGPLVLALFAGGVNLSPAFAAALADVPVLGTLVRVFQRDAPQAEGGHPGGADQVSLTLERDGEEEQLILRYDQDQAALYQVRYERYPGTITLTLPDTGRVEVLDAAARAGTPANTSRR